MNVFRLMLLPKILNLTFAVNITKILLSVAFFVENQFHCVL